MFHPRKRPRFTSCGKLSQLSDDEEEVNTNLTPPEKYTSEIPLLELLFAIPLNFILTHVRNPNEAMLLYEVGTIGAKLDTLVHLLVSQLQQEEVLDRKWRSVCNSVDPLVAAYVPSLAQINHTHFHQQGVLTVHFHSCVNSLQICKQSLSQYVEMNKSVADELLAEGCLALSANKLSVAKSEELLLHRIEGFLGGTPFVNSSISWDTLMADKPQDLKEQKTLHNPDIVKVQPSPSPEKGTPNTRPTITEPELSPINPQTTKQLQNNINHEIRQQKNNNNKNNTSMDVEKVAPYLFDNNNIDSSSSSSSSGNNSTTIHSSSSSSNNNDSNNSSRNFDSSKENQSESDSGKNNENEVDTNADDKSISYNDTSFNGSSQLMENYTETQWQHSQQIEELSQTNTQLTNNGFNL